MSAIRLMQVLIGFLLVSWTSASIQNVDEATASAILDQAANTIEHAIRSAQHPHGGRRMLMPDEESVCGTFKDHFPVKECECDSENCATCAAMFSFEECFGCNDDFCVSCNADC